MEEKIKLWDRIHRGMEAGFKIPPCRQFTPLRQRLERGLNLPF